MKKMINIAIKMDNVGMNGDKDNNNCQKCNENYHFIYNEEGK